MDQNTLGPDNRRAEAISREVSNAYRLQHGVYTPSRDTRLVLPDYEERLLFAGSNGSGKSFGAGLMVSSPKYPRVICLDVKGDFTPPRGNWRVVKNPNSIFLPWSPASRMFSRDSWHIIYRPKPQFASGPWLNEFLKRIFLFARKYGKKFPFIFYIDEMQYLSTVSSSAWLQALAISGRSLKVGLWGATQRPKIIPVAIRSEAHRWLVFYLAYLDDELEIAKYTKGALSIDMLESMAVDYSFFEVKRGEGGRIQVTQFPAFKPMTMTEKDTPNIKGDTPT